MVFVSSYMPGPEGSDHGGSSGVKDFRSIKVFSWAVDLRVRNSRYVLRFVIEPVP